MDIRDRVVNGSSSDTQGQGADPLTNSAEMAGIDHWLSLSIEGKHKELLKQQMVKHINKMKIHRFDYQG